RQIREVVLSYCAASTTELCSPPQTEISQRRGYLRPRYLELDPAKEKIQALAAKVWRHCEAKNVTGRTVTLKVKYADFRQITRARTLPSTVLDRSELER